LADWVVKEHKVSKERGCRIAGLSRSVYAYKARRDSADQIVEYLGALSIRYPMEGFWKLYGRCRLDGHKWNHKRVWPVYRAMGLNVKRKAKRRLPKREKAPLVQPDGANQTWSLDFMSDSLSTGRKFRTLNVLDDFNREALAIEVSMSIPAEYVVRVLERIVYFRCKPKRVRVDNGPEFLAQAFVEWCKKEDIEILYIQPGKPMQNAYIERFNGSFRRDVLDANWFNSLEEVRHFAEDWRLDYNTNRPHETLKNMSPTAFAAQFFSQTQAKA
jgi:putative transposase